MFDEEEKRVSIEPLPEPIPKKKRGRPKLKPEDKKNAPKTTEKHEMTEARKKHYKKMQVMRSIKAKEKRESLNEIIKDKKLGYVVNPVDNPTSEQSLIDASINVPNDIMMKQYSNLEQQQKILEGKLERFGKTFNLLDEYLLSIGVKSSDGSGNSDHILMQGEPQIIQHNQHITPHHGATDPSPFVSQQTPKLTFRQRALMK